MFGYKMDEYDPYLKLQQLVSFELLSQRAAEITNITAAAAKNVSLDEYLPENVQIIHGTIDRTIPLDVSKTFYEELLTHHRSCCSSLLLSLHCSISFISYDGWSHTDPILESPFDADSRFHKQLFDDVREWSKNPQVQLTWSTDDPLINNRLCPHFMIQAGRYFNPF